MARCVAARAALAAAALCAGAGAGAAAANSRRRGTWSLRPCTDADWRFSMGTCSAAGKRNVYAYEVRDAWSGKMPACNSTHINSRRMPPPLLNQSCNQHCPAGTRLGVSLVNESNGSDHSRRAEAVQGPVPMQFQPGAAMRQSCETCPPGRFSLGGGYLVSGVAGDWRRPWPAELQSVCTYFGRDGALRQGSVRRPPCTVRVMSPEHVAGAYEAQPAAWIAGSALAKRGDGGRMVGELERAPDGGLACRPSGSAATRRRRTDKETPLIYLARRGGCSDEVKAHNAKAAGAAAIIVGEALHFWHPTSSDGVDHDHPSMIPLYYVAVEEEETLAAVLDQKQTVTVNMSADSCVPKVVDASLRVETSEELGCEPWVADAAGRFVHSGDNRRFNHMISTLSLSVHMVKDGYVSFRYAVDAEQEFDGFSFEVDWNTVLEKISQQKTYADYRVNLTKGDHTLRWQYTKDYGNYVGEDRAWVQVIEVVGTQHSDLVCRECHSANTHSMSGASRCNACGRDQYLEHRSINLEQCLDCPAGKWSSPGSVSSTSCRDRMPCSASDVDVTYTPCEQEQRHRQRVWREPVTCLTDAPNASSLLEVSGEPVPCEPCQPNEYRPYRSECKPVEWISCSPGHYMSLELSVSHWQSWFRNFSHAIWTRQGTLVTSGEAAGSGQGWRLHDEGRFALAGDASIATAVAGEEHDDHDDDGEHGADFLPPAPISPFQMVGGGVQSYGDAMLHLDVEIVMPGQVTFHCEVFPQEAWSQEAQFLVDATLPERLTASWLSPGHLVATVPLLEGVHRLTWLWQYREASDLGPLAPHETEPRGLRLRNLTVTNAAGAGAARCEACPEGSTVAGGGVRCEKCPPGRYQQDGLHSCDDCPANTFSSAPGSTECYGCGAGTWSHPGAVSCSFLREMNATTLPRAAAGSVVEFHPGAAHAAWQAATAQATSAEAPLEVDGRWYHIGLLSPLPNPDEDDLADVAHFWEVRSGEACGPVGFEALPEDAALAWSVGSRFVSAAPVAPTADGAGGILLSYEGGAACPGHAGGGPRTSLLLRCDTQAQERAATKLPSGAFALPGLLRRGAGPHGPCEDLLLEWPTPAACPLCRAEDFGARPGACDATGVRPVDYVRVRPCAMGMPKPAPGYEDCEGEEAEVLRGYLWRLVGACAALIALACGCAGYLHCRYAKYVQDL